MPPQATPTAITIGNFDGVHVGHAALVRRARACVGDSGRVVALAFDPNPMTLLRPEATPGRLSSFAQRDRWLKEAGADEVERLSPTRELLDLSAEAFVRAKVDRYAPAFIVEGPDFHFGKGRAGNVQTLAALGSGLGYRCEVVEPVEVALDDHLITRASSTILRWLISHGRMRDAARVLGRPYEIEGVVRQGDQRGRTIGVPTANIETEHLLPADGVYAAIATLADGRHFGAAANVGSRPTFAGTSRRLEAHLLLPGTDLNGAWSPIAGLPEYGWPIRLRLISWVREDLRFEGVGPLVQQMSRDIAVCHERLGAVPSR